MNPKDIKIEEYDYPLPDERIARHPLAQRDACKLLVAAGDAVSDHIFSELPGLLPAGAMLVANNTRVVNARLTMHKAGGARIEIFCLEPEAPADYERNFAARGECSWKCLVGNSKRWKQGELTSVFPAHDGLPEVTLTAVRPAVPDVVSFSWQPSGLSFSEVLAAAGEIPIPPYLNRASEATDSTDYQTVYSLIEGSVAAPTAGLHFTPELLARLKAEGIATTEVTLHVGAGTFRPVKSETIGDHDMHSEFITVGRSAIEALRGHIDGGRPVVAVGTTSVRTLESLYHIGRQLLRGCWEGEVGQWCPYEDCEAAPGAVEALDAILRHLDEQGESNLIARTRIIIAPGYRYRIVNGMVTNFHQPKSTLLLLVSAFLGDEKWRGIYDHALGGDYRFLSYGDACLFLK